jgi:hypothetical protein
MNFESEHQHAVRFSEFQKCNYASCPSDSKEGLTPCLHCFGAVMYCSAECMARDRVEHCLACRREQTRQDVVLQDTKLTLLERRMRQRNMNRQVKGGPELMAKLINDLSAEEKATNVVFVPLMYDDHALLNPKSPIKLVKKTDMPRAVKHSNALRQAYEWYIKHQRDRKGMPFLYVCIYTPDLALAEMIALPDDESNSDKLEHHISQCQCLTHRGSKQEE